MKTDDIILVNEDNDEVGSGEKIDIHKKGLLHRAFSIFIFNSKNELLLQQRALNKYHSGGLWTNTCCSHPKPGELVLDAARRRLQEEMGIDCKLEEKFTLIYKTNFSNLIEYEYDHVILGICDNNPKINLAEAADYKWINIKKLRSDIKKNPNKYTYWFKIALPKLLKQIKGIIPQGKPWTLLR